MKILVVDDFVTNVSILRVTLSKSGHTVFTARDGKDAIAVLQEEPMDVVLTDWMMPNLDGLSLIRWIRSSLHPVPFIVVITALRSAEAASQAREAGADAFLVKPVTPEQINILITQARTLQSQPGEPAPMTMGKTAPAYSRTPNYCGIAFGAGTGGSMAVRKIFSAMGAVRDAAFFIVLHGPGWAAEALAEQMRAQFSLPVAIPKDGESVQPGTIYIAPGDEHMTISARDMTIRRTNEPPENFHRPSIDPLFRSIAEVFGRRGVGVVLTGTGIDGYIGAGHLQVAHGMVIVQEPTAAAASQMSQNVIALGLANRVLPLEKIGGEILEHMRKFQQGSTMASHTDKAGTGK